MKNRILLKTKFLLISICLVLASLSFVLFGFALDVSASSNDVSVDLFLPNSNVEYYSLSSPIDAYSDQDVTAIIQNDQTLIVYYNGEFKTLGNGTFTDLQQVKRFNLDTLLVLDNAAIYLVNLQTLTKSPLQYAAPTGTEIISCNFFDFNGSHLVTTFNTRTIIYAVTNSVIVDKKVVEDSSKNPIAINDNGEFFYINSLGSLCKRNVSDDVQSEPTILLNSLKPTKMIADGSYIYYLLDNKIFSISLDGLKNVQLLVNGNDRFDLGNVGLPSGISFKNGNLLITDLQIQAVSEFSISDNTLEFTGFAVAKDKTAFNRISNDVIDIDKDFNTLAVLDGFKLTISDISGEFSSYDKIRFKEFLTNELGDEAPNAFAYGNGYALLSYKHFTSSSYLRLLNVNTGELSAPIKAFDGNVIRDVCYSDDTFYVLVDRGDNQSKIYALPCGQTTFGDPIIIADFYAVKLNVDQSKNVYVYSDDGTFNRFDYASDYALSTTPITPLSNVIKYEFDLVGGLYALTDDGLFYLDKDGTWQKFEFENLDYDIISFALDFDKKNVFIAVDGQELLFKTSALNNLAIDDIVVPDTFVLSDVNANENGFTAYTTTNPSFAYQVEIDSKSNSFTFTKRVENLTEYAFITSVILDDGFGKQVTFYALAGQNVFVLINEDHAVEHQITYADAPTSAFVTTRVNAYYLPIITPDDIFVCVDNQVVTLSKHQQISPIKTFTFLDKDFYLASVTVNQTDYLAYVPVDFTVEILSKDFSWNEYRYETVKKTDVYFDSQLSEKVSTLNDGETIKVYQQDGDVLMITYLSSQTNEWEIGYVNSSALKNKPATAVRNVIIILIVSLSVCATTIFLVVKKYRK